MRGVSKYVVQLKDSIVNWVSAYVPTHVYQFEMEFDLYRRKDMYRTVQARKNSCESCVVFLSAI